MVLRPWVTPIEIKEYTDRPNVKEREETKLETDIARAEAYVISYTKNSFEDSIKYPVVPESVKTAVILIAEMYAESAAKAKGEFKSESFDDYSYTLADAPVTIESLDLGPLLDEFVVKSAGGGTELKLRRL